MRTLRSLLRRSAEQNEPVLMRIATEVVFQKLAGGGGVSFALSVCGLEYVAGIVGGFGRVDVMVGVGSRLRVTVPE